MLRSILTSLSHSRRIDLHHRRRCSTGSMADVLSILGGFDHLFPAPDVVQYKTLVSKCIRSKNLPIGSSLHCRLLKSGFQSHTIVSNVLLHMYCKLDFLDGAVTLFDEMPSRDLVSWCTVISGYVSNGVELEAYSVFKRMVWGGVMPNCFVISSVLTGCARYGAVEMGLVVHAVVVKCGLGLDRFVEIGLVDMYAKCGWLDVAEKVFYEIPVKCLVAWNAMISGYVQMECWGEAVGMCREMCRAGVGMDLVTLRIVASAVSALEMLDFCKNLHVYAMKVGYDSDSFVVAELVRLLSKAGEVDYMGNLFDRVKKPDVSLYSLLISGYHLHGHRVEAVKLAEELLCSNLNLKEGAMVTVLNLCLCREEGIQIHARVCKTGHGFYVPVSNALMSMYVRSEEMVDADAVFIAMTVRDVISWTTIMAGLVQDLRFGEALENFNAFREAGLPLDQHSIATTVNACAGLQALCEGEQIHGLALKHGFAFSDFLNASLVNMYARCGFSEIAYRLFSLVSSHGSVLINVMLAGYCWNSEPDKVLELFCKEYRAGLVPDHFSYSTVLSACADTRLLEAGEQIHCRISKSGFESSDLIIGNAIVNMYVKSGSIPSACRFFYSMGQRNVNTYAMLMLGYIQNKGSNKAVELFYQMQQKGLRANPVAFARILRGCAVLSEIDLGKQVHASIIKMGLVSDVYVGNALVAMYAKVRDTGKQNESIKELTVKNDTSCNSMSAGFSLTENQDRSLKAFGLFKLEDIQEGYSSYAVSILCANTTSEVQQRSVIPRVVQSDFLNDGFIGTTVTDKDRKCRSVGTSGTVINKRLMSEEVFWNSMISEHIEHGWENMEWFKVTGGEEVPPKYIIYLVVYPAATPAYLVDRNISSSEAVKLSLFNENGGEVYLHG